MSPKKILAFSLGPIGGAALGFFTFPIITWLFSAEDIGRVAMLQVAMSFGIAIFSLGLDQAYVREYHDSDNKHALLKEAMLPGTALLVFFMGGFLINKELISNLLFDVPRTSLSVLAALCLMATFVSRFLSSVLRMQEKGLAFSLSQLLPKVFFLLIIALYYTFEINRGLLELVIAHTAAVFIMFLVLLWYTRVELKIGIRQIIDLKRQKIMFQYGIPLIFGGIAFWGLTAIDKIYLRTLSSFEELGIYSVAVSFAGAAHILQSVFSAVWAPTVYKWASNGEDLEKVHRITRCVLICVLLIFCLVGMFSWLVDFILPENYKDVKYILVACLAFPLLYTLSEVTVVGINLTKKTSYAMTAAVLSFMVAALGGYILIPSYGAAGAAASTSVAFWVLLVLRTEFSIGLWKRSPRIELYGFTAISTSLAVINAFQGRELQWLMPLVWTLMLAILLFWFSDERKKALLSLTNIICQYKKRRSN